MAAIWASWTTVVIPPHPSTATGTLALASLVAIIETVGITPALARLPEMGTSSGAASFSIPLQSLPDVLDLPVIEGVHQFTQGTAETRVICRCSGVLEPQANLLPR